MRNLRQKLALLTLSTLAISPLSAQAEDGFYATVRLGGAFTSDISHSDGSAAADAGGVDLEGDVSTGMSGSLALGMDYGSGLRAELEVGRASNNFDATFVENAQFFVPCGETPGNPCLDQPADGDLSAWRFMLNGYYDFDTNSQFTPYVGVGLGLTSMNMELETIGRMNDGTNAEFTMIDESDSLFTWKLMAGFAVALSDMTSLVFDYSYTSTASAKYDATTAQLPFTLEEKFKSHGLHAGISYKF